MRDDDKCEKCQETEKIEHIFVGCQKYGEQTWESRITLINQSKRKSGITIISQDQILFMRDISVLNKDENEETREIIQEIKQIMYSSRMNERKIINPIRRTAHIIKCINNYTEKLQLCNKLLEKAQLLTGTL